VKVLVTGSSGLVGTALVDFLRTGGHVVKRLVRGEWSNDPEGIAWDPESGVFEAEEIEGYDAIVNLAGENIAGRWTEDKKSKILHSRVDGTKNLCKSLRELKNPPKVLISASAIGYYGNQGIELLSEDSSSGKGFLAEVCRQWESAAHEAEKAGIRVVILRLGIVLSGRGGVLAKMVPPFRLGLGGMIGDGSQYMSWIAIDDLVGIIYHALTHADLQGPVNAVSPNPVTNKEFVKTLGKVVRRPTLLPMPAFFAHLLMGEMADELLLSSERVEPRKLLESDYHFQYPQLEGALRHLLGR
jgi:uncharacterized protein (TIGR01777 family)